MSKLLICDKCKTNVVLDPDKAYDEFPEGWINVTLRHEGVKPHEYRDYCSPECAIDALASRPIPTTR